MARFRYDKMVENALRAVVRQALEITAREGLSDPHHFYITFRTRHPGVEVADRLLMRHPEEMTIVIQHQFWGLEVGETGFEVTLSFNRQNERLVIPFGAVVAFADPSAKFGLQFQPEGEDAPLAPPPSGEPEPPPPPPDKAEGGGQVITLDKFRKK
ncbi:MAG: hypothetical protein HQL40_13615 [Alphaproteobacteria bacterium]|nr:hypothetical protein [Alphaproteobacteria bacterium]